MANKFGFDLNDYNPEEINKSKGFTSSSVVPYKMRNAKRWLLWRSERYSEHELHSTRKVPYYADGTVRRGTLDTIEDLRRLETYDVAVQMLSRGNFTGLGFALGRDGEGYWQGIDLDDISQHKNDSLADKLPSYVELSPSGDGVHAIGYGEYFRGKNRSSEKGWEYYSRAKYFTFTGNKFKNDAEIVDLKPFIKEYIDRDISDDRTENKASLTHLILSESQIDDIERALKYIDPDCSYDTWLHIGFSLARVPDGFRLFSEWSKRSAGKLCKVASDADLADQWNDIHANSRGEISLGTLYHHASNNPKFIATEVSTTVKELSAVSNDPLIIDIQQWIGKMIAPDWVVDNFIGEGVRSIAGSQGKGKTSIIAPLCANVAHLVTPNFLTPRHRRVVFYFTEDTNQVNKMVMGMKIHQSREFSSSEEKEAEWRKYFQIKLTQRYKPNQIKKLAEVVKDYNTEQDGKSIPALVVFDTQAASLDVEDENNNAELSKFISEIKLHFWEAYRIPVLIVTHITKSSADLDNYKDLTSRGAGSVAGDCHGTMGIVHPQGMTGRLLGNGKDRDGAIIQEVRVEIKRHVIEGLTPYGEPIDIDYFTTEYFESNPDDRAEAKAEVATNEFIERVYRAVHLLNEENHIVTLELLSRQKLGGARDRVKQVLADLERMGRIFSTNPKDLSKDQRTELGLGNNSGLYYKVMGTYLG